MSDDVDKLVKLLQFLPAPARREFASGLFDVGVRVHRELPTTPNNVDKLNGCVQLAKVLQFLPPPARKMYATALYDLGVRVHPELATRQQLVIGGMPITGDQPRVGRNADMALVREWAPALADKMDAATTEEQKQQILAEIRAQYPQLVSEVENRHAAANYEAAR